MPDCVAGNTQTWNKPYHTNSHVPVEKKNLSAMEGPIEFQPTKSNIINLETTHTLEVLKHVTLIQKRPEGKFNFTVLGRLMTLRKILCEIKFGNFRSYKNAILVLSEKFHICKCCKFPNFHFSLYIKSNMAILVILEAQNLDFLRKFHIWKC